MDDYIETAEKNSDKKKEWDMRKTYSLAQRVLVGSAVTCLTRYALERRECYDDSTAGNVFAFQNRI